MSAARPVGAHVADFVTMHARVRAWAPALHFEGRTWTYRELDVISASAAAAFASLGVLPGQRIAILLPNVPEFVFGWLGALRLGAAAVSVSTAWPVEQMLHAIADADAAVLVTTPELHAALRLARGGAMLPSHTILAGEGARDAASDARLHAHDWTTLLAGANPPAWTAPVHHASAASILYTSGTTGAPRGIVLSQGALAGNALAKAHHCGFREGDGVAVVVPLFHCYGQNAVLAAALAAGSCAVLHRRFSVSALVDDALSGRVTALLAVPPVFERLLDAAERDVHAHHALRRLRYAFSAATALPAPVGARWRDATGRTIHEGYGLTESGPFAAYNHRRAVIPGALGTPIMGVAMAIAEPGGGALLGDDAAGEIVIRTPFAMLGYWRRPEDTARVMAGGWLRTGDIGYRDPMGYFHLLEREDDLVKVAGFRVYPSAVERVLRQHETVLDAAAFGVRIGSGERVEAAVVLATRSPAAPAALDDLLDFCRTRLAPYEVPSRLHARAELPRNATGKVLRRTLGESVSAMPAGAP